MAIRSVALAGMVADTSLYNIDGACVVGGTADTRIPVGTVVRVSELPLIDGHKVVINTGITADTFPYGVVVRSHYETPDGQARGLEAVNVMTAGRIWVRASAAPPEGAKVGDPVTVNANGVVSLVAAGASNFATGWTFAGGYVANYAGAGTSTPIKQGESVDGALIEVQVKQK